MSARTPFFLHSLAFLVLCAALALPVSAQTKGNASLSIVWYDWTPCRALTNISSHWAGGTVTVQCVPLTSWRPTIMGSLQAHSPQYDIVILDSQWIGEAVYANGEAQPYIVELTDLMNDPAVRKSDFIDAALQSYSIYPPNSKHYWGLPFNGNVMLLLYRKSIFAKLNLITPSTLEELLSAMIVINSSRLVPYAFTTFWCGSENDTKCYDETPTIWNQLAWMFGGQLWDDSTYRFRGVLDSNENVEALEFMKKMYSFTSMDPMISHNGALQEFCSGKSAMLLEWFSFLGRIDTLATGCPIADDIGYFPVPGLASTGLHILQIGGMGLHINSYSRNVPAAKDLAKFLISRPMQKLFSTLGGYSVRNSVLAEPDFLFSSTGQCQSYRYIFLQSFPLVRDFWNIPQYSPLLRIQRSILTQALIGNMTSREALTSIATQQEAIVLAAHPCGPACPKPAQFGEGLSTTSILIIAFVTGVVVALIVLFMTIYYVRRINRYPFPKADRWAVPPSCITVLNRLGEGAFGVVFLGRYERQTTTQCINKLVACKYIRENPTREERRTFIKEAETFKLACSVPHVNIVQLIGTCLQGDPMMLIMEYMSNGDVKTWLMNQREELLVPSPDLFMRMAQEAAAGMSHLEHIGIAHCDLAARNCMLDDELTLKITDWGQAHKVSYKNMYQMTLDSKERVLPIRWMAPEALLDGEFSSKTDVWSYGVLLWEIYSFGAMPYNVMTNKEVFEEIIKGYRLAKPLDCPDAIYQVMLACWSPERPSFTQLQTHLRILSDPSQPPPPSLLTRGASRTNGAVQNPMLGYMTAKGHEGTLLDWHVEHVVGGNDSTHGSPPNAPSPTTSPAHDSTRSTLHAPPGNPTLARPDFAVVQVDVPPGYERPFPLALARGLTAQAQARPSRPSALSNPPAAPLADAAAAAAAAAAEASPAQARASTRSTVDETNFSVGAVGPGAVAVAAPNAAPPQRHVLALDSPAAEWFI